MNHAILIRGIQELTDARYYAAMGVDWLAIPVTADPRSFATWHALREWVEGPRFAVELDQFDDAVFAKTMIDLAPDGMVIDAQHHFPAYDAVQVFIHTHHLPQSELHTTETPIVHLPAHEVDWITHVTPHAHVLIETHWTPELIRKVLQHGYEGGFCFNAIAPLQTGLRDYGDMDEMLEMILAT
jgi:hypothetical protein